LTPPPGRFPGLLICQVPLCVSMVICPYLLITQF
jgi:hypothetical protein